MEALLVVEASLLLQVWKVEVPCSVGLVVEVEEQLPLLTSKERAEQVELPRL